MTTSIVWKSDWSEDDHPRDEHGRFGEGGSAHEPEAFQTLPNSQQTKAFKEAASWTGNNCTGFVPSMVEAPILPAAVDGVSKGVTDDQAEALEHYSDEGYIGMNRDLRGERETVDSNIVMRDVQAAIDANTINENAVVFRGTSDANLTVQILSMAPGETFTDKGFVSTSLVRGVGEQFSSQRGMVFQMAVPKGSHAVGLVGGEGELLLGANSKFRLESIDTSSKIPVAKITYVGADPHMRGTFLKAKRGDVKGAGKFGWTADCITIQRKPSKAKKSALIKDWSEDDHPRGENGQFGEGGASASSVNELVDRLTDAHPGIKLDVSEKRGNVAISRIVIPKEERNSGTGSAVLRQILAYADAKGLTASLSPSTDFGGSKAGLERLYGRLGFKPNKGRTADLSISDSWVRQPDTAAKSTQIIWKSVGFGHETIMWKEWDEAEHPRGEHGRFGSGDGEGSDAKLTASSFKELSPDEAKSAFAAKLADASPAAAEKWAEKQVSKYERVYGLPGGGILAIEHGSKITDEKLQTVKEAFAKLQSQYPDKPQIVAIAATAGQVPGYSMKTDPRIAGSALPGGNFISLYPIGYSSKAGAQPNHEQMIASNFHSPAGAGIDHTVYTLTHEWGHTLDRNALEPERPGVRAAMRGSNAYTTSYGREGDSYTSRCEKYAEAFAEYSLSGGKTDNPLAQKLAAAEGWKA